MLATVLLLARLRTLWWHSSQSRFLIDLDRQEVSEFFKSDTSVSISINASDYRKYLLLDQEVAKGSEEILQVIDVDGAFVEAINCAERSVG